LNKSIEFESALVYSYTMTIQVRNNCFKAEIAIAAAAAVVAVVAAWKIFPAYPEAGAEAVRRSQGIVQGFFSGFIKAAPYVPFVTTLAAVGCSLVSVILIYHSFEKTQSQEILYISLFAFSLAFECVRLMVPLKIEMELSNVYLVMSTRALVFGRYFGLFSLFAASVCAAGLETQKQQNIVFIIIAAALIIAGGIPIDGLSWDSSLKMLLGYSSMLVMIEWGILLITAISFIVSSFTRSAKEYIFIAAGSVLVYLGRNILLNSDTWVTPALGLLFLGAGTWLICTKLHKVYLWL
jgi:hypothetical protein